MESNELGPEDVVLVDTNLFVSVGGVDHPKFRKLREFVQVVDVLFVTPPDGVAKS
jgi:hypothetical protein